MKIISPEIAKLVKEKGLDIDLSSQPTLNDLHEVLRKDKNFFVIPVIEENPNGEIFTFKLYEVWPRSNNYSSWMHTFNEHNYCSTYEDALERGLLIALKLI